MPAGRGCAAGEPRLFEFDEMMMIMGEAADDPGQVQGGVPSGSSADQAPEQEPDADMQVEDVMRFRLDEIDVLDDELLEQSPPPPGLACP